MTPDAAQLLWLGGLAVLIALWARFLRRATAEPAPVPRGHVLGTLTLAVVLAAGGAAAWGGLVADDGLRRAAAATS